MSSEEHSHSIPKTHSFVQKSSRFEWLFNGDGGRVVVGIDPWGQRGSLPSCVIDPAARVEGSNQSFIKFSEENELLEPSGDSAAGLGRFRDQSFRDLVSTLFATGPFLEKAGPAIEDGPLLVALLPQEMLIGTVSGINVFLNGYISSGAARLLLAVLKDPKREEEAVTELLSNHGLTAAESSLAYAIYRGQSLASHCAASRIKISTARTHLVRTMSKLGTSSQVELAAKVRVMLMQPSPFAG